MGTFIQVVIIAILSGLLMGSVGIKTGVNALVLTGTALLLGAISGRFIDHLGGVHEDTFGLYRALYAVITGAVFAFVMWLYFDGNDQWKRFKKKTSKALEKLIAKVKELAPTPAPKPLPA